MHIYTRNYLNVKGWLQTPVVLYPRPSGWEGRLAVEQNWTPRGRKHSYLYLGSISVVQAIAYYCTDWTARCFYNIRCLFIYLYASE
jgi:hypothetical protein